MDEKQSTEEVEQVGAVVRCSPQLQGYERRHLRGLGHHLKPIVLIGDKGVHAAVLAQIDRALLDHELVKVKIRGASSEAREQAATAIHEGTGAQVVQILGRTVLLYKAHPEEPKLTLPKRSRT